MKEEPDNLGLALSESIGSEHLEELGVDAIEILVDSMTQSDVISNIPIVGLFYKAGKTLISIRDQLFLQKVLVFLQEHQDISLADRVKFLSKFQTEKRKREFGETVIMLLDSVNHLRKAEIIGKLSRALLLEQINETDFSVLCESVDKLHVADLKTLRVIYKSRMEAQTDADKMAYSRLFNAGLLWEPPIAEIVLTDAPTSNFAEIINHYGKLLVEIALLKDDEHS